MIARPRWSLPCGYLGPTARHLGLRQNTRNPFHVKWSDGPSKLLSTKSVAGHSPQSGERRQLLERYSGGLTFPNATHEIGSLEDCPAPTPVVVHGYLGARHDLSKKLSFVPVFSKELHSGVQIVASASDSSAAAKLLERLKECRPHTPIVVCGELKTRQNPGTKDWGQLRFCKTREIELTDLHVLNEFPADINLGPEARPGPEQRHLQIRQDKSLRDALQFRSTVTWSCREFLHKRHFVEYETPLLFKSTPEGAREFLVPTRKKGLAYALPQSPQQFKQILMGSGIARYFQIARCFRDEDLRADRQPEFTQLDLEMSFATAQDVMACIEELIKEIWKLASEHPLHGGPFPQMTYKQAMTQYGTDKPDLRRGLGIQRVGHLLPADLISKMTGLADPVIDCMHIQCGEVLGDPQRTSRLVREFLDSHNGAAYRENSNGSPGVFVVDSRKPLQGLFALGFEAAEEIERLSSPSEGDLFLMQARRDVPLTGGSTVLGRLGLDIHKLAVEQGLVTLEAATRPLWITDFPLFSPISDSDPGQGGAAGLASTHHPFTSPKTLKDVDLLAIEPINVIGDHYDLVINGVELGGGSRRIHNVDMQAYILRDVLKMSEGRLAEFSHLLEVLQAGCPPHAGIGLGMDRLVAVMLGKESVRDVIAFPKSGSGEDALVKSPGVMSEESLRAYHLKLID